MSYKEIIKNFFGLGTRQQESESVTQKSNNGAYLFNLDKLIEINRSVAAMSPQEKMAAENWLDGMGINRKY